jgi:hypothetical protein
VAQAEQAARAGAKLPACASAALGEYRRQGDLLMVGRILFAKALLERGHPPGTELAKLTAAARACPEERCRDLRRQILREALPLYGRLHDPKGAAMAALAEVKLDTERPMPASRLTYARTPELESACETFEAKEGAGACHRLEKEILGHYTFHDFSRDAGGGAGLPQDTVRRVSGHYEVLINDCLMAEGRSGRVKEYTRYRVRWTVRNDGHVDQVHVERHEDDQGPLGRCMREALSLWRYPPYQGELQHVDQDFAMNIPARTPGL